MLLLKPFAAALALAAGARAQYSTTLSFTSQLGLTYAEDPTTIKYHAPDMNQPATITLLKGDHSYRKHVKTLTDSAFGGSFSWIPSKSLMPGTDYMLKIEQGAQFNYSPRFTITGASSHAVIDDSELNVKTSIMIDTRPPAKATNEATIKFSGSSTLSANPGPVTAPAGSPHNNPAVVPSLSSQLTLASTMSTIPMSRNATFVSPTPSRTGPGGQGPTGTNPGSSQSSKPADSSAASLGVSIAMVLGATVATLLNLY